MSSDSGKLMVECQMALGLTQKGLGDLLGRDRRTIQRWQDHGCVLLPQQAEVLADALRPVRPDLAERVIELGAEWRRSFGPVMPVTARIIDDILRAAAAAGGTSPDAIRPAIAAAFAKAADAGVELRAVAARMNGSG